MKLGLVIMAALLAAQPAPAPAPAPGQRPGSCRFNSAALQFRGSPVEQAQCLLRPVGKYGKLSSAPAVLPPSLAAQIGRPIDIDKMRFRGLLSAQGRDEYLLGGPLDAPIPRARYFVIHDTSQPWLGDAASFPPDDAPQLSELASYLGPEAVAHVFVNRLGETAPGHDFAEPWRASKFELKSLDDAAPGLFLHVELVQPRRRDRAGRGRNDALAPLPGFTPAQYDALALLYVAASLRCGQWLIPAFHAVLDEGMPGGHDDPQHFVLDDFAAALDALRQRLADDPPP